MVLCLGGLAFEGCSGDENENTRVHGKDLSEIQDEYQSHSTERELSPMELDTLRAMKARFSITREEYWDAKGGVLGNEYLELWYPPGSVTVTFGMHAFSFIDFARKKTRDVFGRVPEDRLTVKCTSSMTAYQDETGREWWHYSRIKDDEITYQPISILYQRELTAIAVPHEYYEWSVGKLSANRAPRWLEEGLASVLADEGKLLANQLTEFSDKPAKMDFKAIESALKDEKDRPETRIAFYNAHRMVEKLITDHGRDKIVQAVFLMGEGDGVEQAFEKVYQRPYKDVIASATAFTVQK